MIGSSNEIMNGSADEVRIYNRSLSAQEIDQLYYLTNPEFEEQTNTTLNVTITDEDINKGDLFYEWYLDDDIVLRGYNQSVYNTIYTNKTQNITLIINDTLNYEVQQNWTINTTYIAPTIDYVAPTEINNSYINRNNILINVTVTDASSFNITIKLTNGSFSLLNETTSASSPYYINHTNLADGIYYFNASAIDIQNTKNYTDTRIVTIDTTNPTINLITIVNDTSMQEGNINITYNITDTNNITSCTLIFNTMNITDNSIVKNNLQEFNFNKAQGSYIWYIDCTDEANNNVRSEIRRLILTQVSNTGGSGSSPSPFKPIQQSIVSDGSKSNITNKTLDIIHDVDKLKKIKVLSAKLLIFISIALLLIFILLFIIITNTKNHKKNKTRGII